MRKKWQSCNNPLWSVCASFEADSAAVFTSETVPTSGFSIMSPPRPNVEFSSSSFLCNPRSKVPRKREWILRSNKHTFSDGKKLNSFFFIFLLQVSSVSSLKDRPWHDGARLPYCRTCRKIGSCISDFLISPFNQCFHAPHSSQ